MPQSTVAGPVPVIGDAPNVPADMLALATALGTEIVPKFNTTSERDSAYSTSNFTVCVVGTDIWRRRGSAWYRMIDTSETRPGYGDIELTSTVAQGVGPNTWTGIGWSSPVAVITGEGLTASTSGVVVANAGRYDISAHVEWAGNSGGTRRLIAIGPSGMTDPGASWLIDDDAPKGSATVYLHVSGSMTVAAANTTLRIYAYHDIPTTTLNVNRRMLQVRRVG